MLTRRFFLRGSAVVMAGMGAAPLWLKRAAASESRKNKTLVAIFLRGAADGLNIVVPFGDKRYRELRPSLAIAPPTGQNNGVINGNPGPFGPAIDLDGSFALHAGLQPLKALWDKGQLAIVEATGSPDPTRSHFDAQDYMESGAPGRNISDGWLNRALPVEPAPSPLRAVALGSQVPRTLRGEHEVIAIGNAQQFKIADEQTASILRNMYSLTPDAPFRRTGTEAFEAMKMIASISQTAPASEPALGVPAQRLAQQGGELGRSLQELARLIKADAGVEAAFAEIGGWDHHGNENQQLPNLLRQFSGAIATFCQAMGDRMEDIVLVTMSEFGRTVEENGNGGTDHGHGSMMMVLGGPVKGGKVYGKWPGLEKEQLYEGRDLAVTTDFRAVLSELVRGHLGQTDLSTVFPGFEPGAPLGLLRS